MARMLVEALNKYHDDLARMYKSYVEKPLKKTDEYNINREVSEVTLESVIANSDMGIQNAYVQTLLKEYIISNRSDVVAIPIDSDRKRQVLATVKKRIAIRLGQLKAQVSRGSKDKRPELRIKERALKNYSRLSNFTAYFSADELKKIELLPKTISNPRVLKSGDFKVNYSRKSLSQKQLVSLLS